MIESTLKNGQFTAAMEASVVLGDTITANAKVTKFDFRDDKPLLSLNGINVSDVTLDTKTGHLFLITAEYGPAPASAPVAPPAGPAPGAAARPGLRGPRTPMIPGSFSIIEVGR